MGLKKGTRPIRRKEVRIQSPKIPKKSGLSKKSNLESIEKSNKPTKDPELVAATTEPATQTATEPATQTAKEPAAEPVTETGAPKYRTARKAGVNPSGKNIRSLADLQKAIKKADRVKQSAATQSKISQMKIERAKRKRKKL